MNTSLRKLPLCFLLLLAGLLPTGCDDEISYDDFDEVPIIDELQASFAVSDSDRQQVTVNAEANNATYYQIDWGDGTNEETNDGSATHTYADPGIYKITVVARAPELLRASQVLTARVGLLEELDFSIDVDADNPQLVTVMAVSPGATNFTVNWGDGSDPETDPSGVFTHEYGRDGGTFSIRVTATDGIEPLSVIKDVTIVGAPQTFLVDLSFDCGSDDLAGFNGGSGELSWVTIVPDPVDANNCVMQFAHTTGFQTVNLNFDPVPEGAEKITISWKYRSTNTTGGWGEYFYFGGAPNRLKAQISNAGNVLLVRPHENSPSINFGGITADEWHAIKIVVDIPNDVATYTINGTVEELDLSDSAIDLIGTNFNVFGGGGALAPFYIDDFVVSFTD